MKLQHLFKKMWFSLGLCLMLLPALGQAGDVEGSRDNPLLDRYPRSQIVNYSTATNAEIWLLESAIQQVNGALRARKARLIIGDVERISYQLPVTHTAQEGFDSQHAAVMLLGATPLFQCHARGCGASNNWANKVFGVSTLYGPDRGQHYGVYQLPSVDSERSRFIVLYAITRGNSKVYLHSEFIEGQVEADEIQWNGR
ncbi:hypothetical protein SIN8267_00728 [Sinobacterium norvegicum]|uniref:DUF4892 domain-containing protein n=1 Tax=Sinobacterium norvegicum TaxID=1641715 RepID=A0ABN8EF72_9GAMM|nr:DUF4892 domain-containing protein [Sinobacterium norvegicum]CAH0990634.1 hypothetical protein SIN8267_00728 [Sinobacterium norvegicum]